MKKQLPHCCQNQQSTTMITTTTNSKISCFDNSYQNLITLFSITTWTLNKGNPATVKAALCAHFGTREKREDIIQMIRKSKSPSRINNLLRVIWDLANLDQFDHFNQR